MQAGNGLDGLRSLDEMKLQACEWLPRVEIRRTLWSRIIALWETRVSGTYRSRVDDDLTRPC